MVSSAGMSPSSPAYRLPRPAVEPPRVPLLDEPQRAVVAHDDGPLLVLAGPGTGKTTTLVEAVATRISNGADPDRVLVLTFSRKAADELRERIATRVGRTVAEPAAYTFHGFCHAIVRRYAPMPTGQPPRLLSGAEREVRIRELLRGNAAGEGKTRWPHRGGVRPGDRGGGGDTRAVAPAELTPALTLRGFAREVADLLDRARERGLDGPALGRLGERHDRPAWRGAGDV